MSINDQEIEVPARSQQMRLWDEPPMVPDNWPLTGTGDPRFTKSVALFVPRRFLSHNGIELDALLADVNDKLARRGVILYDGQLLMTWIRSGDVVDVIYEGDNVFLPEKYTWDDEQRRYFGLVAPYQLAEEGSECSWSHVCLRITEPYLFPDERIIALLHGLTDERYFYCRCHQAEVVYTTQHRLVCMGCGAMHAVLRNPAATPVQQTLSAEQWLDYFDKDGSHCDDEVELTIMDFCEIENADMLWTTEQWQEARHDFLFFARSSAEEIQEAIRGTEQDPTIFLEAGWHHVPLPPPPAFHLAPNGVRVDLEDNASHALNEGVRCYVASSVDPLHLLSAVPQLFRAIELLLKAKLQNMDTTALGDQPNMPTVFTRLRRAGVVLTRNDAEAIDQLRHLRNDLQHGTAGFNFRAGRLMCKKAVVFLDRFAVTELGLWIGDTVSSDDWFTLLTVPEIAATADRVVTAAIAALRAYPNNL